MAKTKARKARPARRPDDITIATALERARLKRLVQAKREITRLVGQLRRQTKRADGMLVELAADIARDGGYELRLMHSLAHTAAAGDTGE